MRVTGERRSVTGKRSFNPQTEKGKVAGVTGLEPAASGVTGQRSNQLSYTPAFSQSRGRMM